MPPELLTPQDTQPAAMVPPQPVPTSIQMAPVDYAGNPLIAIQLSTAVGMAIYFLTAGEADEFGKQPRKVARTVTLGLTVVGDIGDQPD